MTVCDSMFADDDDDFNEHRGASGASGASDACGALGAPGTAFEDIVAGLPRPSPWDEVDATGAAESEPAPNFTSSGFAGHECADATIAPTSDSTGGAGGAGGAGGGAAAAAGGAGGGAFVFGPGFTLPEGMSRDGDLARLIETFTRFTDSYARNFPFSRGVLEDDLEAAPQDRLLELIDVVSTHQRQLSSTLAVLAQEVAYRSRGELMDQRLDFQYGYKSPSQFFADCVQIERRDAFALTRVGKAIVGERSLTGERLPAKAEIVADAVRAGELGFAHANEIVRTTEKLSKNPDVDRDEIDESEQLLVDIACDGLPLTEFRSAISHLEGYVNPDGVAPTLEAQRQQRGLSFRTMPDTGMFHVNGKFDAADGAYIRHALEAVVTGTLRACRGHNHPDPASSDQPAASDAGVVSAVGSTAASVAPGASSDSSGAATDTDTGSGAAAGDTAGLESAAASETNPAPEYLSEETPFPDVRFRDDRDKDPYRRDQVAVETRTISQIQADAFVDFAKHVIGCDHAKLPGPSTSVIVRMGLEDFLPPEALAELAPPSTLSKTTADTEVEPEAAPDTSATAAAWASALVDVPGAPAASADTPASAAAVLANEDTVAAQTRGRTDHADTTATKNGTNTNAEAPGKSPHPPTSSWPADSDSTGRDPADAFRQEPPRNCTTSSSHTDVGYPSRVHTRIATIDGHCGGTIIDVGTARMLAAGAGVIPIVLSYDSIALDMGREVRLFTRWQRQALVERDGGCAFCGLPPGMTEAHHIAYWNAHEGATDLDNGILLCSSCHRRVHAGWEIRIVHDPATTKNAALNAIRKGGGTVWFIPPANVDPLREPRLGGRKRFDLGYRKTHPPVPIPGYENASWNNRGPTFRPKI